MKLSFRERAAKLGHQLELLDAGIPVSSTIRVETVDQLKEIMVLFDMGQPHNSAQQLFADIPLSDADEDSSIYGILRRVNEFIFGKAVLSQSDRDRIKYAFPMHVQTASYADLTPKVPIIYNTAPYSPQFLNAGILTLNQGIYISAYQTHLTVTVDKLVRNGTSGTHGDINILGATGATGKVGGAGSQPGKNGTMPDGNGASGITGGPGYTGNNGLLGAPSMAAIITIYEDISGTNPTLTIYTCSGTGGAGGQGGAGGTGGAGGDGVPGVNIACNCHSNGGNAGNGGAGGPGGKGGDSMGGINAAGNIVVNVPSLKFKPFIVPLKVEAPSGQYGAGGNPGPGGSPGGAGAPSKSCPGGAAGSTGTAGSTGGIGATPNQKGVPAQITINPITS